MADRPRNPAVIAMLETLLREAREGIITDAFIVFRYCDNTYDEMYEVDDLGDMVLELRSAVIRTQTGLALPEKPLPKH